MPLHAYKCPLIKGLCPEMNIIFKYIKNITSTWQYTWSLLVSNCFGCFLGEKWIWSVCLLPLNHLLFLKVLRVTLIKEPVAEYRKPLMTFKTLQNAACDYENCKLFRKTPRWHVRVHLKKVTNEREAMPQHKFLCGFQNNFRNNKYFHRTSSNFFFIRQR